MSTLICRFPRPRALLLAALSVAVALAVARTAGAYHTQFVALTCNYATPSQYIIYGRDQALSYAFYGAHEGYQWGGGCWNNNDVDDSPGDPTQDPATGGEGGDCSGFAFKVWRESRDTTNQGFWNWYRVRFVHGPYTASAFRNGNGSPNMAYSKTGLISMDALASDFHIGMIYAVNSNGTDQIVEAKGEAYGTNIWTRSYRGNSTYGGVRRVNWTP
jgi:hypothetical protein